MRKSFLQIFAAIILGLILGAAGLNIYISKEFETIFAENKRLKDELKDVNASLIEISLRLDQQQKAKIINDIKAQVSLVKEDGNLPSFEKTSVKLDGEKEIKRLLLPLKGQESRRINYGMIPQIINEREFDSEGRRYILQAKIVIITDEINIYAEAMLVK